MKDFPETLKKARLETAVVGEKILVIPFGGRIIGLYPDGANNVLWVNPKLEDPEAAASFVSDPEWGGWVNLGGDRTWISPEIDTHVGDPERLFETYKVPTDVDPAAYKITDQSEKSLTLSTEMKLLFKRANVDVDLGVTKKIDSIDTSPIPVESEVAFTGYVLETSLQALSDLAADVNPAIWNLLQVPGSGRIFLPVREGAVERNFFGRPDLSTENSVMTCPVSSSENIKFALRASQSTGWMLYHRSDGDTATLLVRRYELGDDSEYFDVPYDDLADGGYATEIYIDDGAMGGFGELEYHSPALTPSKGGKITDTSETWAFLGPGAAIEKAREAVIQTALG